ncbi:MAG: ATP-binding protein [Bacteroidetes bacterium]|nr:ATP-binding protein [Bacteroidota bacterium]
MSDPVANIKKISILKPKYIIFISVVLVILMILSSVYEYNKSKNEIYAILEEYSTSMIQTASMSSANSIISDREMESLLAQHLLSAAKNTARVDSLGLLNNDVLIKLAQENDVFRINVFDKNGSRVMTNNPGDIHSKENQKYSPVDYIQPILKGEKNEIVIGLKEARMEKGNRYAVAVRRPFNRGAIVVNLDAESYMGFRNRIGFGKLILDIGSATGVEYIILQNQKEILAANKNVNELPSYENDEGLKYVFETGNMIHRIVSFGGEEIYEAVSLFKIEDEKIGLFRIGVGMDGIIAAQDRMLRRAVLSSLIVIVISVIVLSVLISNQNYRIISDEFRKIKTFTGSVLENMSLAIITADDKGRIKIFNKSAFELFGIPYANFENKNANEIEKLPLFVKELLNEKNQVKNFEYEYEINSVKRSFLVNSAIVNNEDKSIDTYSLVIEDITEAKEIEIQLAQNERLAAMGGLASGVAHEIRNPLNTINMVAQRMNREYSGRLTSEDFDSLIEILGSESRRVDGIIEQFLNFARPAKLNMREFRISEFLDAVSKIAEVQSSEKGIKLVLNNAAEEMINADYQQLKQVFINLLRNAVEATDRGGTIEISYKRENYKNIFEVKDSGCGISAENLNKIFDIYFTTKSGGTGMGLSIVRQIILQHNGKIAAESDLGKGTKFTITLP